MPIKAVLFDLDGTLLPMDQESFINAYLSRIAKAMARHGYDPETLVNAIWAGTAAMIKNDGTHNNRFVFWNTFSAIFGKDARKDEPLFDAFYRNEFSSVQESCGFTPRSREILDKVKRLGLRTVLATNPVFPAIATHQRIKWAGLKLSDFEYITTYENASFCKPNLQYYEEILSNLGLLPEECLMVGNDVSEDMVAHRLGMQVFLLTPSLVNKKNAPLEQYPHGDFDALLAYLNGLNSSGPVLRRAEDADLPDIMDLQVAIFTGEQHIPETLVRSVQDTAPQWWCARQNGALIGAVASWKEKGVTHWGRFAVSAHLRGQGIGKALAKLSLETLFAHGVQQVCLEARDSTVHIICSLGGRIIGPAKPFFKGSVTPVEIRPEDYRP